MKLVHLAATVVLVGATTVACGGSPSNASVEDFCAAFADITVAAEEIDFEKPTEGQVADFKDVVADFADTGTPEDIPEEARAGFELLTERFGDLPDDASAADLEELDNVRDEEQDKLDDMESYLEKTCEDDSAE